MHICFITTGDIKSIATAKRALGLANHLSDLDWNVTIIMDDTEENRHRVKLECDSRTHVYFLCYHSAFDEVKKKNNLIRQIKPDVLYICAFVFRNIVALRYKCIKLVEHSELQSGIRNVTVLFKLRAMIQETISVFYANGLLNASKFLQNHFQNLSKQLGRRGLSMLYFPYAYNQSICQFDNKDNPIRKEDGDKYFVYLGSLAENYGAFMMIKAFEVIHKQHPSFHLLLLGKGPDYKKVVQYIEANNLKTFVHTPGFVKEENISAYFTLADAFISPMNDTIQDWARCPSKLYMYLPYQKPIITCKIGEPYETLKEHGIYFEPNSPESLAEVINDMVEKKMWVLNMNPFEHEWKERAKKLDCWISETFYK